MKKLSLMTIVAAVLIVNIGSSQEIKPAAGSDFRNKISMGLKVGANYSNVYDSQDETFHADPKFGLAAGGFVSIPIGKLFGVQPEILFSQKGFKATGTLLGTTYTMTRTTSYLDIPILFAFKPTEMFTVLAGPQYSYLMKQKNVFTGSTTSVGQETEFNNDNVRKNTLCFTGGADVTLTQLVIGARAGWDIKDNNGDGTSTTPRYKNMWYQLTLGYRF